MSDVTVRTNAGGSRGQWVVKTVVSKGDNLNIFYINVVDGEIVNEDLEAFMEDVSSLDYLTEEDFDYVTDIFYNKVLESLDKEKKHQADRFGIIEIEKISLSNICFNKEDHHPEGVIGVSMDVEIGDEVVEVYGDYGALIGSASWELEIDNGLLDDLSSRYDGGDITFKNGDPIDVRADIEEALNEAVGVHFKNYQGYGVEDSYLISNITSHMANAILNDGEVDMEKMRLISHAGFPIEVQLSEDYDNTPSIMNINSKAVEIEIDTIRGSVDQSLLESEMKKDGFSDHDIERVLMVSDYLVEQELKGRQESELLNDMSI